MRVIARRTIWIERRKLRRPAWIASPIPARRGVDKATDTAKAGLDWAADQADTLRDRNAAFVNAMTDTVAARPLMAIGVAAAVGYLLGRLMRSGD
jgi:ElaB/YqjD/DUF883 family membrane-anchored ribosome-binding protein